MSILVENLSKNFGKYQALDHVNLEIQTESLVALVGASGSGKSTLLRIIAGLETPDQGNVWLEGISGNLLSIQEREIGFVFQNYVLFNHLTVYENIAFGLDIRRVNSSFVKSKVGQLLELIELESLSKRYPNQLSGGQRQRVALARALAIEPIFLLLDEPFGALDMRVRKELRDWLRRLHEQVAVTTLFVTHDYSEAKEIAQEIIVFERGHVEQIGPPQEIVFPHY